jgi:cobalt-precorrin 5A hydrolase
MIVAGIGCRRGASAAAIQNVVVAALERAGLCKGALGMVAAPAAKATEQGLVVAAAGLGVPLRLVSAAELTANGTRTATRSERVIALMGVACVCEAAALAAGGPAARLVLPRLVLGPATCALAEMGGTP